MKDNQILKPRKYFGNYLNTIAYHTAKLNIIMGKRIEVKSEDGANWEYAWISDGKGKGHMVVF